MSIFSIFYAISCSTRGRLSRRLSTHVGGCLPRSYMISFSCIAALDEFIGHVPGFAVVVEAGDTAAAVKVGPDTHMVDSGDLNGMIDVVDKIAQSGGRMDLLHLSQGVFGIHPVWAAELPVLLPTSGTSLCGWEVPFLL